MTQKWNQSWNTFVLTTWREEGNEGNTEVRPEGNHAGKLHPVIIVITSWTTQLHSLLLLLLIHILLLPLLLNVLPCINSLILFFCSFQISPLFNFFLLYVFSKKMLSVFKRNLILILFINLKEIHAWPTFIHSHSFPTSTPPLSTPLPPSSPPSYTSSNISYSSYIPPPHPLPTPPFPPSLPPPSPPPHYNGEVSPSSAPWSVTTKYATQTKPEVNS